MQKSIIALLFMVFSFAVVAQNASKAEIKFEEESYDFGNIPEGPKVHYNFEFKNEGTEPLVLENVKASCGCTVPEWPKAPILAGETGEIAVTYNTKGRIGNFNKAITITSNAADARKVIYIKGKVEAPEKDETIPVKAPSLLSPN